MPKINPFRPNHAVPPGLFVGRLNEVGQLERGLYQTRIGNPRNFLITGERGIGKTSLMLYVKAGAHGLAEVEERKLNFLVAETDIDKSTSQLTLVQKIQRALDYELSKTERAKTFLKSAWSYLQRIEAAGVSLREAREPENAELVVNEFTYSLADIVK